MTLAVGLVVGLLLAGRLVALPVGATLLLGILALSSRSRLGGPLAALALGLLVGWVRVESVARDDPALDSARPMVARVRPLSAFRPVPGGWSAPARVESLRQGPDVAVSRRPVWLFVGGEGPAPRGASFWARGMLRPGESPGNGADHPVGVDRFSVKSRRLLAVADRSRRGVARSLLGLGPSRVLDDEIASGPGPRLAAALALGQAWRLEEPMRRSLRDWGLAHLTAASGLHVGMLASLIGACVAWGRGRSRWLMCATGVLAYCTLVGGRPALLRAVLMLGLGWASQRLARRPDAMQALGVAAGALLLIEPRLLDDLGFRLSFAATLGILCWGSAFREAWRGPVWLRGALSVSVGAQLATLPFTAATFGTVPLLAPLLNLFFVPWTAVCLVVGGGWLGLRLLGVGIDGAWLSPLSLPFEALTRWEAPWWAVPTWTPSFFGAAGCAFLVASLLARRPRWLVGGAAVVCCLWAANPAASGPELWMLDVGQGDSFLLRSGRRAVLIDGGGWREGDFGRRVLLPALGRLGVRRIDLAILSHPDMDHCAGLADAAGRIRIDAVWLGPDAPSVACGGRLVARAGADVVRLEGGERAAIGAWLLEVAPIATRGPTNRRSVVVRAAAGGQSVLFTGDLDADGERRLGRSGFPLRADVLKVAHHGSRSSTTGSFLRAVSPRYALISAGRGNRYGHPAPPVVDRLLSGGATLLRTDLDGRVGLRFLARRRIALEVERVRSASAAPADGSIELRYLRRSRFGRWN